MAARLLVSLSGLSGDSPESLARVVAFTAALDARGVPVSQLLRPAGSGPLRSGSAVARWMRGRRAAGDAIVLHGYDHTPDPIGHWQPSVLSRVGRRAEFALLPRHEAGLRLIAARRVLERLDLHTDLFAPPRWLASAGTVAALREQRFAVLADEDAVHLLRGPAAGTLVRARVLGFRVSGLPRAGSGGGRAADAWRARVLVAEAGRIARRGGLVRINVRAKDLGRPVRRDAALAAVDRVLGLGAVPLTYRPAGLVAAA